MQKKNWRRETIERLRKCGVTIRIPCVEALTALVQSGSSIGFDGRVKLITELRDAGKTEDEIIRIFTDSPFFFEKYFDDIVITDTRTEPNRSDSGYMIRPDIWNDYQGISCGRCREWCEPGECYRSSKKPFFNEKDSPSHAEFREQSQKALKEALSEIFDTRYDEDTWSFGENLFKMSLIEAPMASGKTFQAVSTALDLAAENKSSLILTPDHTTCAEAVNMAVGMEKIAPGRTMVHLAGKNDMTCLNYVEMVGPCASCGYGIKAFTKKHAEFVEELLAGLDGIYSRDRMKSMVAEINKELGDTALCLRTLAMLIAPGADIVVAPFVFLIDKNLSGIFSEMPNNIFIDEADLFSEQLANYCKRVLTIALPRLTKSSCFRSCRKKRCKHCKLSYSTLLIGGDMEPRNRATEISSFDDPAEFIGVLEDALQTVRDEMMRGVIRNELFDLDAVADNIANIRALLKPRNQYKRPHEYSITVEEHLRRENEALTKEESGVHSIVETGPVFGFKGEITRYPFVKLKKILKKEATFQYVEEPSVPDGRELKSAFSIAGIYSGGDTYSHYRDGDISYKNHIRIFLNFAEFCEDAPGGALLRHVPRSDGTEVSCKILLSYMHEGYFRDVVDMLQANNTVMMSGTFLSRQWAAASLLLREDDINYFEAKVKMHDLITLVLHNGKLGSVLASGSSWDNPAKPKILDQASIFAFFNYCIRLLGGNLNLYLFTKNKNMARSFYDTYKRNSGGMLFKAHLADSHSNILSFINDDPLLQHHATPDARRRLACDSRMIIDNYRSARSRGVNLPDFQLSVADGNGRANFENYFDQVAAINRATGRNFTLGELLGYNRNRAVCQAMLRTPRDDRYRHLCVYNGDMTVFDVPEYLQNRVIDASDLYHDFISGTRREKYKEMEGKIEPSSNQERQVAMLAAFFQEILSGEEPAQAIDVVDNADEKDAATDIYAAIRETAKVCTSYSETVVEHVIQVLKEKGYVAQTKDQRGRKSDWLALLRHLEDVGVLEMRKKDRSTIYVPVEICETEAVPGEGGFLKN